MIGNLFAWLPGNDVLDWATVGGTAFCLFVPAAFLLWALRDKLRHGAGDHHRPFGEDAPAAAEAAEPTSPFRRKRGGQ